ncbi:MAG: hypothetical protein IPK27_15685 [Rhodanobacteraceae bacterium]|nr:hypothetical protein [Rhodanobacteraceae bacterium]
MRKFVEEEVRTRLQGMAPLARGTVALCAALRLLPAIRFGDPVRAGSIPRVVAELSSRLVTAITSTEVDTGELRTVSDLAGRLVGELPTADSALCDEDAYLDDACICFIYAAQSMVSPESDDALNALTTAYNAVDQWAIREIGGNVIDEGAILSSPVVQSELDRQSQDISLLEAGASTERRQLVISRAREHLAIPVQVKRVQ